MNIWFIEQTAADSLREMKALKLLPSGEQMAAFNSERTDQNFSIMEVDGNVAKIPINGILTQKPDIFARLFGGGNTAYSDIVDAVVQAESSVGVERVEFHISSPGGQVAGMFDTMDIIAAAEKPSKAIISGVGASAAYGLASQADEIVAVNDTTQIGSVGVATTIRVFEDEVALASDNAPEKMPDVTTETGKNSVKKLLNDLAAKFSDRIADGRSDATGDNISASDVNSDFGRGGVFLADKALKAGMIDAIIGKPSLAIVPNTNETASSGNQTGDSIMDLETLKAQHSSLYAQILAEGEKAGIQTGISQERERVEAHLIFAENSGQTEFAHKCIKDGKSTADQTVVATYMTATRNNADITARQKDNADLPGAGGQEEIVDNGEKVVAMVEQLLGVETVGVQ